MSEQYPGDFSADLARARELMKEGRFDASLEQVDRMLELVPGDVRVLFLKGVVQRRRGEHESALQCLRPVVEQVPELAAARQELGLVLYALRDIGAARRQLLTAVKAEPGLAAAWKALGDIYAIEGDEERASAAYRSQLIAENPHPGMRKAVELVDRGKLGMAEGILREYLQRFPKDSRALRLLAEVGLKLGIYPEAQVLLERCLELAPDYHLARNNYANALGKSHKFDLALQEIDYLRRVEPNNLAHPVLQASLQANLGDFPAAARTYEELLRAVPDHPRLQTSYGHVLKTVGRQSDSVAAYRKAIDSEPSLGEAWWSLANLKTFRFESQDLDRMRKLLARDDLETADRFHLCFALGKGLEDAGEFDASFDCYARGNQLKREQSGYRAEDTSASTRAAIEHCTRSLFKARRDFGHEAPDPIFIVGLPRSGSTLLEQILASHSRVEGTMELPYISQLARELGGKKKRDDVSRYPAILWDLDEEQCRALGQRFLDAARAQRTDTPLFIDKMPNNFAHVGLISLILPNAKIIDARRHPMATCFSCYKQLFAAGQEFTYSLDDIGRYYCDYVALMDHWDAVLPGKVLPVQYEMVVGDFEAQVRRLLDFCSLDFEPACLEFYASDRAVRTASSEQVRQPIYSDALEQWRHFERHLEPLKAALEPVRERYPF
jgi:predicted Zn-dependent protease